MNKRKLEWTHSLCFSLSLSLSLCNTVRNRPPDEITHSTAKLNAPFVKRLVMMKRPIILSGTSSTYSKFFNKNFFFYRNQRGPLVALISLVGLIYFRYCPETTSQTPMKKTEEVWCMRNEAHFGCEIRFSHFYKMDIIWSSLRPCNLTEWCSTDCYDGVQLKAGAE